MESDSEEDVLHKIISGSATREELFPTKQSWPRVLGYILEKLDEISHNEFPIPKLPPPPQTQTNEPTLLSPLASSPIEPASQSSSQDANKENNNPLPPPRVASASQDQDTLPPQILSMLDEIRTTLSAFTIGPPHTMQRLAELIVEPRRHYRALAPYLHAVDRVVHVTSGTSTYPLPPIGGGPAETQANGLPGSSSMSWGSNTSTIGTDEALGGALLTAIPWLTRRPSPEEQSSQQGHAELRTESTETIEGPNGVGSIETVSISLNGVPSMGASSTGPSGVRGVTQGELLREAQRAGVVPATQLHQVPDEDGAGAVDEDDAEGEIPHARGPAEIGVEDLGPQPQTSAFAGELHPQDIDVEAAIGRKAESRSDNKMDDVETGSKRGAEDVAAEETAPKKVKSEEGDQLMKDPSEDDRPKETKDEMPATA